VYLDKLPDNATIGNESLREISNNNVVRVGNFETLKYLILKGIIFLIRNIHKCTWTSAGAKTRSKFGRILSDKRQHSNTFDVPSFRGADCGADHHLVITNIRERERERDLSQRAG
jgi:hypothetical protein